MDEDPVSTCTPENMTLTSEEQENSSHQPSLAHHVFSLPLYKMVGNHSNPSSNPPLAGVDEQTALSTITSTTLQRKTKLDRKLQQRVFLNNCLQKYHCTSL
jgi:hypothetical protein